LFLRLELVLVTFDCLQHQRGIGLDEGHERRVGRSMVENK
jgi:hypothetical protein